MPFILPVLRGSLNVPRSGFLALLPGRPPLPRHRAGLGPFARAPAPRARTHHCPPHSLSRPFAFTMSSEVLESQAGSLTSISRPLRTMTKDTADSHCCHVYRNRQRPKHHHSDESAAQAPGARGHNKEEHGLLRGHKPQLREGCCPAAEAEKAHLQRLPSSFTERWTFGQPGSDDPTLPFNLHAENCSRFTNQQRTERASSGEPDSTGTLFPINSLGSCSQSSKDLHTVPWAGTAGRRQVKVRSLGERQSGAVTSPELRPCAVYITRYAHVYSFETVLSQFSVFSYAN